MKEVFVVLSLLVALSPNVSAEDLTLTCLFTQHTFWTIYRCSINDGVVPDDDALNISFDGEHVDGLNDTKVNEVHIKNSETPFIIVNHLVKAFPSLDGIWIWPSGLTRIQPNAFTQARNLDHFYITRNPDLRVIPANAFEGASKLTTLEILECGVDTIHENAFNGLDSLQLLSLSSNQIHQLPPAAFSGLDNLRSLTLNNNKIHQLPPNIFQPLVALMSIHIDRNDIKFIDERLFAFNAQIEAISLSHNWINEIGWNFLDGMQRLRSFHFIDNVCADNSWEIADSTGVTLQTIRDGLASCFLGPDVKEFEIELQGHFTFESEDGAEVFRI